MIQTLILNEQKMSDDIVVTHVRYECPPDIRDPLRPENEFIQVKQDNTLLFQGSLDFQMKQGVMITGAIALDVEDRNQDLPVKTYGEMFKTIGDMTGTTNIGLHVPWKPNDADKTKGNMICLRATIGRNLAFKYPQS